VDFDSDKTRARPPAPDATAMRAPGPDETRVRSSLADTATPGPAAATFGPGYRLRGRYLLDKLIGRGAMGEVWRAKDLLGEEARDRNPYVAVKVLNSDFNDQPDAFVAMHREATRAQKLAHPNIVTVYVFDRDEASGRVFIAMELLEGQPLDEFIRTEGDGGTTREKCLPILRGMAEGLAYAHRKGIVHSDFKPANVFLTVDGTPKILDFGIARAVQAATGVAPIDDDGGFQGYTATYASPEVLRDEAPTTADDVFALGLVAYELVTGVHPFKRLPALQARPEQIEQAPLRGLRRRERNAINKSLSFERSRRFPDARAFLAQLQGVPPLQTALLAAVGALIVTAGVLWYRNYAASLPDEPLSALPQQVQQQFLEQIRQGNESLEYRRKTNDLHGSDDAADYFANAYRLHKKDPQAVAGLQAAAADEIAWYLKYPDKQAGRTSLENLRAKSDYYGRYEPLEKAIRALGGE
jgi:serine/threonine protein kinase